MGKLLCKSIKYVYTFILIVLIISSCRKVTKSDPLPLEIKIYKTDVTEYGGSDGSIDLEVTTGNPPYQFLWSNGATTEDLSNISAGVYSVTVIDSEDLTCSENVTIEQPDLILPNISLEILHKIGTSPGPAYSVDWSPINGRIAYSSFNNGYIIDPVQGVVIDSLVSHNSYIWSIEFSPDGEKIASGSQDGKINIWDTANNLKRELINGWTFCVDWQSNGSLIASGNNNNNIRVWDIINNHIVLEDSLSDVSGFPGIISIGWSPVDNRFAVGYWNNTILIIDFDSNSRIIIDDYTSKRADVNGLDWSPDGQILATAHQDGNIRLWDTTSGKKIRTLSKHTGWARGVSFSPDGTIIATTGSHRSLIVWDVLSGQNIVERKEHSRPVWAVDWSPDGSKIVTSAGVYDTTDYPSEIIIWSVTVDTE